MTASRPHPRRSTPPPITTTSKVSAGHALERGSALLRAEAAGRGGGGRHRGYRERSSRLVDTSPGVTNAEDRDDASTSRRSTRGPPARAASCSTWTGSIVQVDQQEHEQITPKAGWVEHDSEGGLAAHARGDRRGAGELRCRGRRHRGDRHHQPARDDRRLGPRDRRADLQRDRLAGHAHRRRSCASSPATRAWTGCARPPGCRCPPTSRGRRSPGSSTTWTAPASGRRTASWRSGRWTPGSCGT